MNIDRWEHSIASGDKCRRARVGDAVEQFYNVLGFCCHYFSWFLTETIGYRGLILSIPVACGRTFFLHVAGGSCWRLGFSYFSGNMIQQRIGDLLEIQEDGKYFYVVVLTKIVVFGGNIVFAFHNDGEKREVTRLVAGESGFNICTDLLLPKRERRLKRLHRYEDISEFWQSQYVKGHNEYRPGAKANDWFIYTVDKLGGDHIARVKTLAPEYRKAMDNGCYSFDLVAKKVLDRYTPDLNEHI